jgi:Mg2+-importing ATPase
LIVHFLARFTQPMLLVLLAAAGMSAVLGDLTSFALITAMVLLSVALDFVQEHRAGRAAEALEQSVAVVARALRDGQAAPTPVVSLVPGDVVLLSAGGIVPADGLLLAADDLYVNEAALTGEAFPVAKSAAAQVPDGAAVLKRPDALFMGSTVVSGSARLLVGATGDATMLGGIAVHLADEPPPTEFERGMRRFGALLSRWTMGLTLFALLVNLMRLHEPLNAFLFAVALAVGLTPELLPMIVSVTLARGAIRLARAHVIVKRLSAIEDLGAMDVLCTDKTGTLTEAHVVLAESITADGSACRRAFELAWMNSHFETGVKSPLDEALLAHERLDPSGWVKRNEVPFDFVRRRVSVLLEHEGKSLLILKGAPEEVLRLCTLRGDDGSTLAMDDDFRERALERVDAMGAKGQRVLAVATKTLAPGAQAIAPADESELTFVGLLAFVDPPKLSAAKAFRDLGSLGVAIKVITGDSEAVTRHLCGQLGLPVVGLLNGTDIQVLDDAALRAAVERVNVFCRMAPAQKARVVQALRAAGHVVGYMGDGINDAPPLTAADVGVSVDGAVDVARQAADLILLRHSLVALHHGVLEGRRTFANVMKYIKLATSSNFGNMLSMAGSSLFLPFFPMTSVQILLNNFLYDLSELALPLDDVDRRELQAPRRWDLAEIRRFMLTLGPLSSAFDIATFALLLWAARVSEQAFHTAWFIESLATQVLVVFIIRTPRAAWRNRPSRWLVLSASLVIGCAVALPFTPAAPALGLVPLPGWLMLCLLALTLTYLACAEGAKRLLGPSPGRFVRSRRSGSPPAPQLNR